MYVDVTRGEYLRQLRKQMGLSLNQVAKQSGISSSQLSRMERGISNVSLDHAFVLSYIYKSSIKYLASLRQKRIQNECQ